MCLLQQSLYGLKQAPRAWYQRFAAYLRQLGFSASASDTSLFVLQEGGATAYLLLYINDIVLTASTLALLQRITERLHSEFAMTDLGDLHHFLGISVTRSSDGLFSPSGSVCWTFFSGQAWPSVTLHRHNVDARAKLSTTEGSPSPIPPSTGVSPAPFSTSR